MPIGHAVHQDQGAVLGSGTDPWSEVVIASGRNKLQLAEFVAEMVLLHGKLQWWYIAF